ncbi:MAG: radical SAM family heme chaperone HemW [Magnetospirillum sp. WYHS-4]
MFAPIALYLHWPFCRSKCGYCDFNSVAAGEIDQARWRAALVREMEHFAAEAGGRTVESIFFGGGTPSLMAPETVAATIEAAHRFWRIAPDAEVTLEANPTSVEAGRFAAYRDAGINRLSVGVQSLDDQTLAFLGREHSAAEAQHAVELAARIFPRHSIDLIYAHPNQDRESWAAELKSALPLVRDHISLYELTVEEGTPFGRHGVAEAPEELGTDLYKITQEILCGAGLPAYEVSSHARPGAECRYNLHVWRGGGYLGIGPGAHGRLTGDDGTTAAIHQVRDPARWLDAVERAGHGTAGRTVLSAEERRDEAVLLGLRLAEGIGPDLAAGLPIDRIIEMIESGHLRLSNESRLATTPTGRLCLNAVTLRLLA